MEEMMEFVKDVEAFLISPLAFGIGRGEHYSITLSQNVFLTC